MASEQIKRLIDEGKITLTLVVSPPRCKSTAIAYALSRGDKDTCYLHEPVSSVHGLESSNHGPEYNIEERDVNLDNLLLPRIEKAIAQAGDDSKPIPIVLKEMSNGISIDEFDELARLSKQIVFLQCDPSKQIASALTIIAKDDPLISNPVSYMPEWGAVDDLIYSPWKRQTALLHNAQNNFPGKVTVLDSELAASAPKLFFKPVFDKSGLHYSPEALSNWPSEKKEMAQDTYTDIAQASSRLKARLCCPHEKTAFHEQMQPILEDIQRQYLHIMKSPAAIVPPQHDLAVKFLSSQVDGHAIWHYVPLAAHAVLSKLLKPGVAEAEVRDRAQEQMDILHTDHPELSDLLRHKVETPRELVRQ